MENEKVDIFIPYLEKGCDWKELRYALRSIDKHLKTNYQVTICGDLPAWIKNVNHIPHKRKAGIKPFPALFDVIRKVKGFVHQINNIDNYILWYDDVYLLRDIDLSFFNNIYALRKIERRDPGEVLRYQTHRVYVTYLHMINEFKEIYNHETHLPRLFNKEKVRALFKKYSILEERLLISTLYYTNYRNGSPVIILNKKDNIKAGFYTYEDNYGFDRLGNIKQICKGKTFLNHNGNGFSYKIKRYLKEKFKEKSKFEI